ncbi:MAG: penicillin-binding protein 1C [Candidatus Omnitrophica bacterium]|nr:penicillin-binding protein 1C [Candidatus Omnitrophota bacterium]
MRILKAAKIGLWACGGVVAALIAVYGIVLLAIPFPRQAIKDIHYSTEILDKDGRLLYTFLNDKSRWQLPIELSRLDNRFIQATLSIEDRNFYKHSGVDVLAVVRSAFLNIKNWRKISGASTISMQTIRILEGRKRSLLNKIIEMVHAVKLEQLYSKEQILKMYLELAPYGGNIHGVRAASLRYLNKEPGDLTLAEAALLAGLPQSPSRLRPDRYPDRAKIRRDRVLQSMVRQGVIDSKTYASAVNEPVIVGHYEFPKQAPHFSLYVKSRYPSEKAVRSSLDGRTQDFVEATLKETVDRLRRQGVTNGAIVVIENKTGKVRAFVGSANFASVADGGQVNGALSPRSPGSTLKPFTYALALQTGRYSTRSVLDDVPSRYAEYLPRNFDKTFRGKVSLREALVDSLNIPAIELLDDVGYHVLHELLRDVGLKTISPDADRYGFSLTLGSPDVRLLDLTNAYAMLARLGIYKPVTVIEDDAGALGKRLLNDGAAYVVTDILADTSRFQAANVYSNGKSNPKIAFKTGTSYGQRDAWTFAYNPEFTVGVWLGNFDGKSSKVLVGVEVATPLAARIFDWIYEDRALVWYDKPDTVIVVAGDNLSVKTTGLAKQSFSRGSFIDPAKKPEIVSPAGGAEYFISGIQGSAREINLQAKVASEAERLFWFVNGALYKTALPYEKIVLPMTPGRYQITCADNFGRNSSVSFYVR